MKKYILLAATAAVAMSFVSFAPSTPAYACGGFLQAKCPPPKPAPKAVIQRGTTPTLAVQNNKPLVGNNNGNGIVAQGGGNIVAQGGGNLKGNGIVAQGGGNFKPK